MTLQEIKDWRASVTLDEARDGFVSRLDKLVEIASQAEWLVNVAMSRRQKVFDPDNRMEDLSYFDDLSKLIHGVDAKRLNTLRKARCGCGEKEACSDCAVIG